MKTHLLIAESDAKLRDYYRRFLTKCNFEVETAADGLNCLEKLRQIRPPVLVLDQELRWGGGDGVLAWMRENCFQYEVAVVLTATAGSSAAAAVDFNLPVYRFLSKPFALKALLESVRAAVAESRQEEPAGHRCREPANPRLSSVDGIRRSS